MFNFTIFSGNVVAPLEVIYVEGKIHSTIFKLNLTANHQFAGIVTVVCEMPLADTAAESLAYGEYVVIEGFLRRGRIQVGFGKEVTRTHIFALEILKCVSLGRSELGNE